MNNHEWHKLDNSAKIYPLLLNNEYQNLFRITVEMKEIVEPAVLNNALTNTIVRYPSFNVGLKRGLFWHYLEQLDGKPVVIEDSDLIIRNISTVSTFGYNFRVAYYDKRIAVDFFHALCDGNGGLEFVKTLVYEYLRLQGHLIDSEEKILLPTTPVLREETEDAFLRYSRPIAVGKLKGIKEMRGENAFLLEDYRFEYPGSGLIQGEFDTQKLLALSKENNATMTAYLGAVLIYSIYKTKKIKEKGNKPIVLFIPINLRKIFPSRTLLNFSLFSRCKVDINGELEFADVLERTKEALKRDIDKESLQNKLNATAKTERFLPFRMLPLIIKQVIFKISQLFFGKGKKTLTFSNLGNISLPSQMNDYVEKFTSLAATGPASPSAVVVCSSFGRTTVSFTRRIVDTEVEKYFFRYLAKRIDDIIITGNYWEVPNVL